MIRATLVHLLSILLCSCCMFVYVPGMRSDDVRIVVVALHVKVSVVVVRSPVVFVAVHQPHT